MSTPPIRIHDAVYIPHLRAIYFFGATPRIDVPSTLTVQLKQAGKVMMTTQRGVQPLSPSLTGLLHDDVIFLESGLFYGFFNVEEGSVDEVTAGFSGSTIVRRREVRVDTWREDLVSASLNLIDSDLDAAGVDKFTRSSQLRSLALTGLAWMRRNPDKLGTIDDLRAAQLGEAFRKSVMKSLSMPILTAKVPAKRSEADSAYTKRFDLLCDALDHNATSRDLCLADLALNGETSWTNINMGHYHFGRQELDQADGFYLQSARILQAHGQRNIHFNNGVFTWRSHAFSQALEDMPSVPSGVTFPDTEAVTDARLVHLIGCDDGYFQKYGNMCIYSSLKAGHDSVLVHVHVCNPSAETLETLEGWSARKDVMVRYSYEQRDIARTSVPYYTTLRFLVGPEVMAHYDKPVVISDVDMVVNQPWQDTIEAIGDADAGYISSSPDELITRHYGPGMRPWDVAAGTMYFSNSELGRRFLAYVGTYIRTVLSFPKQSEWYLNWGVDQVALRKGVDVVLHPNGAKVRNLRTVRMLRGPQMHLGGKAQLASEPAPGPHDALELTNSI